MLPPPPPPPVIFYTPRLTLHSNIAVDNTISLKILCITHIKIFLCPILQLVISNGERGGKDNVFQWSLLIRQHDRVIIRAGILLHSTIRGTQFFQTTADHYFIMKQQSHYSKIILLEMFVRKEFFFKYFKTIMSDNQ